MVSGTAAPYPLRLEPILLPKVWGGDRLAHIGKRVPPGARIGESWEVADLASTSTSGAGGGAQRSVIANGALAGQTLHQAMSLWGADLLGRARPVHDGFPMLVKLLDAREHLSVQVHPSPAYAARHPEVALKHECWYILQAAPGARLFAGVREGIGPVEVASAVTAGTLPELLVSREVAPGECHLLPSGTVHALGAGILIAEVQTPSDTTFRLYDWTTEYARPRRELHVEASLEAMLPGEAPPPRRREMGQSRATVAETGAFVVDELDVSAGMMAPLSGTHGSVQVLHVVAGVGVIEGHDDASLVIAQGDTVVLPAALASRVLLSAQDALRVLVAEPR